jgi:hypothetical protein
VQRNIAPQQTPFIHSTQNYEEPQSQNEPNENQQELEEIPQSEKNRFHQRLKQLTQQELAQIVLVIQ